MPETPESAAQGQSAENAATEYVDAVISDMENQGYFTEPHTEINVADTETEAALRVCTTDDERALALMSHGFWVVRNA